MEKVKYINQRNLQIARENMGLDTVSASKKITVSGKDLVREWEMGILLPSWPQLKKLAKLYGVSEILLSSKVEIQRIKIIPDYRVGSDKKTDLNVKRLINLVIKRQCWVEKNLKGSGIKKNHLIGSGKHISNPNDLAHLITEKLDIELDDLKSIHGMGARKKLLKYLIEKAEHQGIFVGKTISYHNIEVSDMRGLFIANEYCPYIILNRKDAISAQIFSFAHELAHLFRKTEAISNSLDFRSSNKNIDPEEVFCNRVAAELLLPQRHFAKPYYTKADIDNLSEIHKVSKIFIFYRLKDLNKIPHDQIDNLERKIKRETQLNLELKKREKSEGGNFINSMKDSNGGLFNRIVSSSYYEDEIGYVEASRLLCFSVEKV